MAAALASARTTVLPLAAAAVTMALLLQVSAAAAPPLSAPAPVGLPGCNTSCAGVEVPYPFGFGPARCYWPGLNLTCDTRGHPPRLLLGDGTLRVTEISLKNSTVRVIGKAAFLLNEDNPNITYDRWSNYTLSGRSFGDYGYILSSRNVLVVSGCNMVAALLGDIGRAPNMISGCTTFCDWSLSSWTPLNQGKDDGCYACCVAPVGNSSLPILLQVRSLYSAKQAGVETRWGFRERVLLAEEGWVSEDSENDEGRPLILQWSVTQGMSPLTDTGGCPDDVSRKLCKSQYSDCIPLDTRADSMQYSCQCREGFGGNPYLAGGCQDIDECKLPSQDNGCRTGECINTFGSFYCGCPQGSYGVRGRCIMKNSTPRDASSSHLLVPAPIGLRGCNTTCGKVQVPYPFGFGPERCYLPGFNLTCGTNPPRLLLGDGTFQVVDISLPDSTVRVIRALNFTFFPTRDRDYQGGRFDLPDIGEPYSLSPRNEFVLNGCSVQAALHLHRDEYKSNSSDSSSTVVLPCNCSVGDDAFGAPIGDDYCSGTNGCCHAPISFGGSTPKNVTFVFYGLDDDRQVDVKTVFANGSVLGKPIYAFLAEGSSMDHQIMNLNRDNMPSFRQMTSPLVLQWAVKQGFQAPAADNLGQACPGDVARRLCVSDNTDCRQEHGGYTCRCSQGYDGNPYIQDGCKDVDECKIPRIQKECFGDCINLAGAYECRCPRGTHGNASLPNGCRPSLTGLSIGIGVGSGAGLILLVLIAMYMIKKLKHRRSMKLKQKFFKQNRGQLLQQLVAQRADIAERMIIPLEELEKATDNFHKDRELGGGGHGTVYMGILSDKHVVAVKKSNIVVKREIDEFINEVAFLSQISHRNVVKLFGCCLETEVPLLVYEFVSNGTLSSHLHVTGAVSLSWDHRLRIATETAKAIAYLHSSIETPLIHRDIKPTNILLDNNLTPKVSDFGASRHIPTNRTGVTTNVQGTFGYMDPEYFYTGRLTEKSDVFSFGVLLVELLTRKLPCSRSLSLDGEGHVAHFATLLTSGNLVDILDPQVMQEGGNQATEVAALAAKCVERIGDNRPTMRQVELTLEAIQGKEQDSNNATAAETLVENGIRRRWPSDPEGIRRTHDMTRQYSLEEEYMLSARDPR